MRFILLPLLLGHAIGDFYFQTNKIARQKTQKISKLILHVLIYAVLMAVILVLNVKISNPLIICWSLASASHGVIDLLKFYMIKSKSNKKFHTVIRKYQYFIDQALHFIALSILTIYFYDKLSASHWRTIIFALPASPMVFLTGFSYLLKPVSLTITEFFQVTGLRETINSPEDDQQSSFIRAGNYIGMLERILIFCLILYDQYAAIGFLMTAKTITRFKDLEKRKVAEYYLIGTLLSIAAAFGIALICK